jgi:hypothetical protein
LQLATSGKTLDLANALLFFLLSMTSPANILSLLLFGLPEILTKSKRESIIERKLGHQASSGSYRPRFKA